jgi:hypothetical protein
MINITLMLADQATIENGKLYILGGGWDRLNGPGNHFFTITALVEIAVENEPINVTGNLSIMDPNGKAVIGPDGNPIVIPVKLHAEKPEDSQFSGWIQIPLVFRFENLTLPIGNYTMGLAIGDYATSKNFVVAN